MPFYYHFLHAMHFWCSLSHSHSLSLSHTHRHTHTETQDQLCINVLCRAEPKVGGGMAKASAHEP